MNPYGVTGDGSGAGDPGQYTGGNSNGYSMYGKPGFFSSANKAFSPFSSDPYWGHPVNRNNAYANSMATRPMDGAAWIAQRVALPALAFGMTGNIGAGLGSGLAGGLARGIGFGSIGAGAAAGAGALAGPIALGYAASYVADQAFIQPYSRSRQMSEGIYNSFSNVTMPGFRGGVTGRGIDMYSASRMGSTIDSYGTADMTFSAKQYNSIASMGMNSGLFDNVGSQSQILSRVKSIASQVKMITAISNDPSIQSAIAELAKLQMGGASVTGGLLSQAGSAYSAMGSYASAGGVSIQRLMSGVGSMGQSMFGSAGMTPYIGMLAAGSAYAGFSSGNRMGILSSGMMARLGGTEGATQGALSAQINAGSTPYNMLRLHNQYFGGGASGSMVGNASVFGHSAATNPLGVIGNMSLYGGAMRTAQSSSEGNRFMESNAIDTLRASGQAPNGPGGKYSPSQIAAVWKSWGMSDGEVQAAAAQRAVQTDPGNVATMRRGYAAQADEQYRQALVQYGTYGGGLGKAVTETRQAVHNIGQVLAHPGRALGNAEGKLSRNMSEIIDDVQFGSSTRLGDMSYSFNRSAAGKSNSKNVNQVLNHLSYAAGNADAGPEGRLASIIMSGEFTESQLRDFLSSRGDVEVRTSLTPDDVEAVRKAVKTKGVVTMTDTRGATGSYDTLMMQGLSESFLADLNKSGFDLDRQDKVEQLLGDPRYAKLRGGLSGVRGSRRGQSILASASEAAKSGDYISALALSNIDLKTLGKDPGKYTSDPELQKRARGAKSDAELQLIAREIATKGGKSAGRSASFSSAEDYIGTMRSSYEKGIRDREAGRDSATSVDWSDFLTTSKRIEDGANTLFAGSLMFKQSAEKIAASVGGAGDPTMRSDGPGR